MKTRPIHAAILSAILVSMLSPVRAAEDWTQFKFNARHSGNVPHRSLAEPLGLLATAACSDSLFTAPVVAGGRVFVVDGAGVAWCFDADTLDVVWKFATPGGQANCNNVSSPAIAENYLHFGTMAGSYYVLDTADGRPVNVIDCGEPIFATPVVGNDRVYFATLGSRVHALQPNGAVVWTWDFVREVLEFPDDRFSGEDWVRLKGDTSWKDQFFCVRNPALVGDTLVLPAGGLVVWLQDTGEKPRPRATYHSRREAPATLGLSIDAEGAVYRQWTRRDNGGNVEILRPFKDQVKVDYVRGTETSYQGPGSLSFSSVSIRGNDVYRCRPEEGFGLCRHSTDTGQSPQTERLGGYPSINSPILLAHKAVYGGLDGSLHVVPLSGNTDAWSFKTAFGRPVTAPVAVSDGRVYFGCEDGYLYALGPNGNAPLPTKNLQLENIRSPLTGPMTDPRYDWDTAFGNPANTNAVDQGLTPPLKLKWVRRYEGTVKHFSVCGGGRMYTHTAEGQIFAVEQQTGRLLWRRYFPGVHISYTSPLYHQGRLYVPQAGLEKCRLRCLDAADGSLVWEAPFTGSPSWNRQLPPIVHDDLVIYLFSSGAYTPKTWLFEHQSTFGFPDDQRPLVRAFNRNTGQTVWTKDFSEFGAGGDDAGMCLMDGRLYYSCYFGDKKPKSGKPDTPNQDANSSPDHTPASATPPKGVTAAIEPATGKVIWTNTQHTLHAGCTVSGDDGRIYLGGYNPVQGKTNRVWCLDADDGALVWQSEPVDRAIHVVTIGQEFLFTHAQYKNGYILDKKTGKIVSTLAKGYRCTRFTLCEPYLLGPNMTLFDLSDQNRLVASGPVADVLLCVGAFISNGRLFYTTNGGGTQLSYTYGEEAAEIAAPGK